jgi:hypothetical protein
MAAPPYGHDLPFDVDYSTLDSFDLTFDGRATPNAAYPNSNIAGPTHAIATPSFRGFCDAPVLNSPTLRSDASLAWIPEESSAYERNVRGYGPMGALER